jgi:flagellar biogenesis protein FliO
MRFARHTIVLLTLSLAASAASAAVDATAIDAGASAPVAAEAAVPAAPVDAATGATGTLGSTLPRRASGSGSLASGVESRGFSGEILPTAAALAGTLLAIVLARSAIRRFGSRLAPGQRPSGVVEILARYPVARGQQVVLLKVGRRVLVVHQGAQAMQTLSEFATADDVADIIARCEAGAKNAKDPARDFSFDALLRTAGKSFDEPARGAVRSEARGDARNTALPTVLPTVLPSVLPAALRGAEIETVDLTRGRRGGAR